MVRTSGGIRISAGKSSKKGGGGGSSGGASSRSSPSTPCGKSSSKTNNRLPPIPHCEAPLWQKPITNFFNSDAGPSKCNTGEVNTVNDEPGPSKETGNGDPIKRTKEAIEKDKCDDDGKLPEKRRKDEEVTCSDVKDNSKEIIQNDKNSDEKQSTNILVTELTEKTEGTVVEKKCIESDASTNDDQLLEKHKQEEEKDKENIVDNISN